MVKFMYVYNFLILILCIFSVGNEESKSLPKPVVLASTVKVSLFGQKKILIFLFIHFVKGGSYKKNSTKKLFFLFGIEYRRRVSLFPFFSSSSMQYIKFNNDFRLFVGPPQVST